MYNYEQYMDEIIDLILDSKEYLDYQTALKQLDREQELLEKYQNVMERYNEQKKYEKYIDLSSIKNELKEVKQEMNENKIIKEYYLAYHALNDLLNEVTHMIFDGLLDDAYLQPYFQ